MHAVDRLVNNRIITSDFTITRLTYKQKQIFTLIIH